MTDPAAQRLPSSYLEDLAYIILSARYDQSGFNLYPDLDDDLRARLRSRIKQLGRYDFPSSMAADPAFRRGYTLRQCLQLAIALLLLDAHLPPSLVVVLARNNEHGFLSAMARRLADPARQQEAAEDQVAVILAAEIQDALAFPGWAAAENERVRFVQRADLPGIWSDDLAGSGVRLIVDVTTAAAAIWRWISGRRLMDDAARLALLADLDRAAQAPAFLRVAERTLRR